MAVGVDDPLARVEAVLFDVDGTLYLQPPLRLVMALEMALLPVRLGSVAEARRAWLFLRAFRHTQEELRAAAPSTGGEPLARRQLRMAAEKTGVSLRVGEDLVNTWMLERPLRYLPRLKRPGLDSLLATLAQLGVKVGALSDYPAGGKLRAMGITTYFSLVLCAADPPIGAFKPATAGFLAAAAAWSLAPSQVLYVGDREDVDRRGATAAGMPSLILTRRGLRRAASAGLLPADARGPGLRRLASALRRARYA